MADLAQCPPFNGTSALYGLGIRIGVYLQLVSSHVTNTVRQDVAPANYATSSIFVFAIIVALLKAASANEIRPIEAWIMLQICMSFMFTVLGLFGVRLWFLHPRSLETFRDQIRQLDWEHLRQIPDETANYHFQGGIELGEIEAQPRPDVHGVQHDQTSILRFNLAQSPEGQKPPGYIQRFFRWARERAFKYVMMESKVSLHKASFIKHSSMSWAGAAWRTSMVTVVASANIWFWFKYVDQLPEDKEAPCSPVVFFFAQFLLFSHPRLKTFFKVGSIFMVVPLGILVLLILIFLQMICEYLHEVALRAHIRWWVKRWNPASWQDFTERIKGRLDGILPFIRFAMGTVPGTSFVGHQMVLILKALHNEVYMNNETAPPTFKDLLKAYVYLSSEAAAAEKVDKKRLARSTQKPRWYIIFCFLIVQLWSMGAITWFIAAVELTIKWNHILDVQTVATTGQLIALIIGIVSSVLAVQEVVLTLIKYKYEDWDKIDFEIGYGPFGTHSIQLVKRRKIPDPSANQDQTPERND